jgi:predicted DsbA family dithiol-disulfide isomerase
MRIDIVSDAICPWCYIGKRRFERALAQLPADAFEVGWRPFQLNPDMPREGMDRQEYLRLKFGEKGGGKTYTAVEEAGRAEGIPFNFAAIKRTPSTLDSHRLIRFAERIGRQDEIVEAVFRAYFIDGMNIGDQETLVSLAAALGIEEQPVRGYLASNEDEDQVRAEDDFARKIGINGVPCFIIDRKYAISGAQPPEAFIGAFAELGLKPVADAAVS